ncbi:PhnD/SsuA/transferrin family substrate-binding protein [Mesoplasma seiffertii]|uniref:PhnD/SsuA/transferrin family substrate-binding protein n=1 Tax=Mesoplasma seiffertii TaxID=28224 RepID=UPI00047AABDA|nr:PhnD/SsuA/transferrin family substrate-binding protein [Mesoplasma seiffertii]
MKKLLTIISGLGILSATTSTVVACGNKDEELRIVFIPSNEATSVINTVKPLEQKLTNELKTLAESRGETFKKKVVISTSTNYEAAGQSLQAGKAALAFLPIGTYNQYKGTKQADNRYSDLGFLLNSTRDATIIEHDYFKDDQGDWNNKALRELEAKDSLALAKNYNDHLSINEQDNKETIQEKLTTSEAHATYYRSYIYANNKYLEANPIDWNSDEAYKESIKKLVLSDEGKNFSLSASKTSSAGMIYPLMWLKNTIGLNNEEIVKVYHNAQTQSSYPDVASKLGTGQTKMAVGYSDIRIEIKDNQELTKAFNNSQVVGVSEGILNDGIAYSRKALKNQTALITDLRTAFQDLVSKPENKEIFDVYKHSGYNGPGEEDASKWEASLDQNIDLNSVKAQEIMNLIKGL